jgi:hypothetical protein
VLSGLSGEPATSSAPGSSAAPSRGHAKPAAPRHAGKHGRQGQPAGITRAAVEPAPKGALAAVSSSAGSLFSGEIGSLLALLVAVTLGGALTVLVRRRAKAD